MKELSIYLLTLAASVFAACEKPYDYSKWYEDTEADGGQEIVTEVKDFDLSVMCFNVKNSNDDKGTVNSWDNRRVGVYAMIKDKKPHVMGLQECFHSQKNDILKGAPTRFSGEAPESEPETAALCNFIRFQNDLRGIMTLHTQGEEIFYKSGGVEPKCSVAIAKRLAKLTSYRLSDAEGLASYGGLTDWCVQKAGIPSFTLECGKGENPLPISQHSLIYLNLKNALFAFPTLL